MPSSTTSTHAVLEHVGPLPLEGRAWPKLLVYIALLKLGLIALYLAHNALQGRYQALPHSLLFLVLGCFAILLIITYFLWHSTTRITATGIQQSWFGQREIRWEEIRSCRLIPFFHSKRLVCFPHRGRPLSFQASDPALQNAFAHIVVGYSKKQP